MSVTNETLTIIEAYRAATVRIQDAQTRTLVAAWANAWNVVADELSDAINDLTSGATPPSPAKVRRSRKLAASLDAIGAQLDDLARQSGVVIVGDLPTALQLAGQANAALIATQLPELAGVALVVNWDRIDRRAIAAIITRTTERIHALSLPLSDEAVAAMRRSLIRGLATGDNPRVTARRMLADTEGRFNGGLTRTLRIARTETLDAMRAAARLSDEANAAVLAGRWAWTASLSTRTCPACWSMHGQEFPLSQPGPEGHVNCRCARVPVTKTWADLGFIGIEEPPSLMPDAEAAFAELDPAVQLEILGRRRYEAWLAGDYPMGSWARRVDNPDWRPSWQVTPAPAAA